MMFTQILRRKQKKTKNPQVIELMLCEVGFFSSTLMAIHTTKQSALYAMIFDGFPLFNEALLYDVRK